MMTSTQKVEAPCVTSQEASDLILFMLPTVLDAVAQKCSGALPPDAYLLRGGHDLSQRLAGEATAHKAAALSAFRKIGNDESVASLREETLANLMIDVTRGKLTDGIKPAECRDVNEGAELLSPLPPANLAGLAVFLIRKGVEKGSGKSGLRICEAPRP
jgi:hypothetical protein